MVQTLAEMKRNSAAGLNKLADKFSKAASGGGFAQDDRFWFPETDKAGNGAATVRFLPAPPGEDDPFVNFYTHSFKGTTGKWYIEHSLSSVGKDDPVVEMNSQLWNSGSEKSKEQARAQKRKLTFVANVLVISDEAKPENNGKVFLFRFGKKIYDKMNDVMNPKFAGDERINPFDPWTGANFKIRIKKVENYNNYDSSVFAAQSALFDGDEDEIERVWKQCHKLKPFIDPDNEELYKPYDVLKKKLHLVLGLVDAPSSSGGRTARPRAEVEEEMGEETIPAPKSRASEPQRPKSSPPVIEDTGDDGDSVDYFKKLARVSE